MLKGRRAERALTLPIPGSETGLACVAVPLAGDEEAACLAYALKYAQDHGVKPENARLGEPLFDLAYAAKMIELSICDPASGEPGKRSPTFIGASLKPDGLPYGSGVAEILGELQRETIHYLFKIAEEWCDICSPLRRDMSDLEMLVGIRELAKEGDDGLRFFDGCGPSLRWIYMRFIARQLLSLLEPKSSAGSSTETKTSTPTASSPSPGASSRGSAASSSKTKSRRRRSGSAKAP